MLPKENDLQLTIKQSDGALSSEDEWVLFFYFEWNHGNTYNLLKSIKPLVITTCMHLRVLDVFLIPYSDFGYMKLLLHGLEFVQRSIVNTL